MEAQKLVGTIAAVGTLPLAAVLRKQPALHTAPADQGMEPGRADQDKELALVQGTGAVHPELKGQGTQGPGIQPVVLGSQVLGNLPEELGSPVPGQPPVVHTPVHPPEVGALLAAHCRRAVELPPGEHSPFLQVHHSARECSQSPDLHKSKVSVSLDQKGKIFTTCKTNSVIACSDPNLSIKDHPEPVFTCCT